jgi:hypothetical protein
MKSDKFIIERVDLDDILSEINKQVNVVYQYKDIEHKLIVLIAERYYLRMGNNKLTATIIIEHINRNQYQVIIVITGGAPIATLGAESSMLNRIKTRFLTRKQKYVKIF